MPIFPSRKVAFIHIPKCAGSSLEHRYNLRKKEFFFEPKKDAYTFDGVSFAPQHLTPALLMELVPNFSEYRTFCITRHPYDKMVSEYFWLHRDGVYGPPQTLRWNQRHFRRWLIEEASKKNMDHLLSQWTYAKDCTHVIPIEELAKHLPVIDGWFGHSGKTELGHFKRNKASKSASKRLNQKSKDLIFALYREDFDSLGFER